MGLDPVVVTCDEQDIKNVLHGKFEGETIITQYSIKNKWLDAYMPQYKIGTEIDKYNHKYRNFKYEESRTKVIENHEITLIRTNPDDPSFDIKNLIVQIRIFIKKRIKKSLIDDLSKRLLELDFKSNYSIKSKCLKWVVKNIFPNYKKMKNTQSKIKSIKIKKQPGTTYCFRCKDYTQNFTQKVKMTNKILREKSHCVVCWSNKPRFLKQKIN